MSIKKSGIITICGRPNVGKSTLTNAFVGEKVAIVTNKPQTTRNRICAILNRGESQFVFVDTPGLHKARTRLGDYMVNVVKESVADVDAVILYDESANTDTLYNAVKMLTDNGKRVMVQKSIPEKIRYKQLLKLQERGVEIVENNA